MSQRIRNRKSFGSFIRDLRTKHGYGQRELAKKVIKKIQSIVVNR